MNRRAIFEPCRRDQHRYCTAAGFDAAGEPEQCNCDCHGRPGAQETLFPRPAIVSVQPDLFSAKGDTMKALLLTADQRESLRNRLNHVAAVLNRAPNHRTKIERLRAAEVLETVLFDLEYRLCLNCRREGKP